MNSCAKNGGAPCRCFPAIFEKPEWGVQTPPPARHGLTKKPLFYLGTFPKWPLNFENVRFGHFFKLALTSEPIEVQKRKKKHFLIDN